MTTERKELTEKHSFVNDTIFRTKSLLLTGKRGLQNWLSPTPRFQVSERLSQAPVIALSESDLWNPDDNRENWILTAGKIENLRRAVKHVNGLEVKAGQVFSFWRHLGNPNLGKGYVVGREIREGCIVPTVAGGLCQLSNALYDAALKARFDILERHRHTRVIKGSLAEQDRDATVKWNYIDLRFKSSFDFRIEAELTADKLIVSFKSEHLNTRSPESDLHPRASGKINDCYSCGNMACFKHPNRTGIKQEIATTTFILDERWPEFDQFVLEMATDSDHFILPLTQNPLIKTLRYNWKAARPGKTVATTLPGLYRALKLRFAPKNKNNVFELSLQLDQKIAAAAARKIPTDSTHLVISQNLLPFLYAEGALGGRTYDVLMTRLPMEKLHERLDQAFFAHPESPTLKDFRAPARWIALENNALTRARQIITPHAGIAEIFKNKALKLNWHLPSVTPSAVRGDKVLFPASAVGRKGAYEIRQLAKELNLDLRVSGSALEKDRFWEGVKTEKFDGDFSQIGLVVYPAFVEHQPRQILRAIALGIPVVTTTACGLDPTAAVDIVEPNSVEKLKNAARKWISV